MERTPHSGPPQDNSYVPIGDPTHLADYWGVISRRLWLVLVIFGVTTATAIWAVARQPVVYQAYLTLRVNDPIEPARGLVTSPRITGIDILTDPMVSEIEVLKSSQVATAVIEDLGLRLVPSDPTFVRSDLIGDPSVDSATAPRAFNLVYDAAGVRAQLLDDASGEPLAEARVGETMIVPEVLSFTVQAPPGEQRTYGLMVVPQRGLIGEVAGNIAAVPKENTNVIDVYYQSTDPAIADDILNAAALELREIGARRVSDRARTDIDFIEQQLDSVREERNAAAQAIQTFKTSRDFTTLTTREQTLVNRLQNVQEQIQTVERERAALSDLSRQIEELGPRAVDFPSIGASLPRETNGEVIALIDDIRDQRAEVQRLISVEGFGRGHPRVGAAEEKVDQLGADIVQAVNSRLAVIQIEISELLNDEAAVRDQQREFPNLEGQLRELQRSQSSGDEIFEYLQGQLFQAQLRASASSAYVDVIDEAFGTSPLEPKGELNIILGGLLGIILGVGAAFFLEYLDRTVRTSSDVEGLLGVPVLGIIPRLRRLDDEDGEEARQHGKGAPLVVALDPLDPAAEAYRNLRMNLMFMSTEDEPVRTILFSSPGPDEGKSTTAVNFAVMLAQQGQRVLLIDSDLRRPSLHRSLDLLREPGLTNLLIGDAQQREAIRPNVLPNLDVLPSGPFPPNPSELLNSRAMEKLLEEFGGKYTQIIIDSPPILAVTDASVLAGHVDGAVIVLRSGETEQRAAERAVEQLRRLNVRILGAVLNEVPMSSNDESYYLQYYYHYQPTHRGMGQRLRESLTRVRFW